MSIDLESKNCSDIPQLISLVEDKSIGMLTCLDFGGALVSTPIFPLEIDKKGAIWFFINLHQASACHLCNANLSFKEAQSDIYMSLSGSGEINKNQARIESLWTDSIRTFFPEDPRSTNLALLKFSPYAAESWDVSQSKMVSVFTMSSSVVPSMSIRRTNPFKFKTETNTSPNYDLRLVMNKL